MSELRRQTLPNLIIEMIVLLVASLFWMREIGRHLAFLLAGLQLQELGTIPSTKNTESSLFDKVAEVGKIGLVKFIITILKIENMHYANHTVPYQHYHYAMSIISV